VPASSQVANNDNLVDSVPMYFATASYKRWVWSQMKAKKITLKELARRINQLSGQPPATDAFLSMFLGPKDADEPRASTNTTLMPAINKVLRHPPPPLCDPASPISALKDRFAAAYPKLTDLGRDLVDKLIASTEEEE
jgi:hypothetical protein